jgi:hypothetical protein
MIRIDETKRIVSEVQDDLLKQAERLEGVVTHLTGSIVQAPSYEDTRAAAIELLPQMNILEKTIQEIFVEAYTAGVSWYYTILNDKVTD